MKKVLRWIVLPVSLAIEVLGILSLMYINNLIDFGFLSFYGSMRLILKYVVAVVLMAGGIITFNVFGMLFDGKAKKGLLIGVTTYSTILTIPLLYVFVGCFIVSDTLALPMVNEIAVELTDIFKSWDKAIFGAGVVMSVIFLAVPILSTYFTLRTKKGSKSNNTRHFQEVNTRK